MDWANERWVKLYTRDTVTWTLLSWQARALLCLVLRKVDRSGRLELGRHGSKGLAAAVAMPVDVVKVGLEDLLGEGVAVLDGSALFLPHFEEAQQAQTSVAERSRRHRERKESNADATRGNAEQRAATQSNAMQRDATTRNDQNRSEQKRSEEIREEPPYKSPQGDAHSGAPVTGSSGLGAPDASQIREVPTQGKPEPIEAMHDGFALTPEESPGKKRGKTTAKEGPSTVEVEYARVIVGWLNAKRSAAGKVGKHLDPYSKVTIERVRWLRKQGWTTDLVLLALDLRVDQWRRIGERNGEDWTENLHPSTSLNGKLQAFIERAQRGEVVQARSPTLRPGSHSRNISGADMLRDLEAMERANVIDID